MFSLSPDDLVGWLGVSLGVISTWFQFRRARSISVDGISLVTWFQFILMGFFWISYGIHQHSAIIAAGAGFVMPMQISIVMRLKPWRHVVTLSRSVAFIFTCCALPTLLFGWSAGVYGIGFAMAFNRVPQIMTLIRHRGDLGVSVGSWSLGALCSAMWIAFYAGNANWAGMVATAAAMAGNVAIAALASWRHRQVRSDIVERLADARDFSSGGLLVPATKDGEVGTSTLPLEQLGVVRSTLHSIRGV
jgi:hypothetical protein